jgi:hypothetical protein
MRSMVEGPLPSPQNPSTALRAIPLPRKSGGGISTNLLRPSANGTGAGTQSGKNR